MESKGRQRERGSILGNHNKSKKGISKSIFGKIECFPPWSESTFEERMQGSKEERRREEGDYLGSKSSR